jgi:hypothetical protein
MFTVCGSFALATLSKLKNLQGRTLWVWKREMNFLPLFFSYYLFPSTFVAFPLPFERSSSLPFSPDVSLAI